MKEFVIFISSSYKKKMKYVNGIFRYVNNIFEEIFKHVNRLFRHVNGLFRHVNGIFSNGKSNKEAPGNNSAFCLKI